MRLYVQYNFHKLRFWRLIITYLLRWLRQKFWSLFAQEKPWEQPPFLAWSALQVFSKVWLKFGVIWWRFDEEMKKKIEELGVVFPPPLAGWNESKRESVLIKMKLPREAKMCGPKWCESQLTSPPSSSTWVTEDFFLLPAWYPKLCSN